MNHHNHRESMFLNLYISVICICFGFRYSDFVFRQSWPLYICRERSTNQLLFMQNKPNFQDAQMNANSCATTDYENIWQWRVRKNKPNQSQFPKVQNELKIACQKIWPQPGKAARRGLWYLSRQDGIINRVLQIPVSPSVISRIEAFRSKNGICP